MTKKAIRVWSYLDEYKKEKKHIISAVEKVFASGQLILGENVSKFEQEFAKYCGVKFGIGVGNGTDAIFLALKALGIGEGDEVITVPNTAIPTVAAIAATGAIPVMVDIDEKTFLIDTNKIEAKITARTKCILPVHLYGQCCNMEVISSLAKKYRLKVVEDCAQAAGAKRNSRYAGSMSDIAAFSLYPTKILGAYGDAGIVITNSDKLAKRLKMLRMYGISKDYYSEFLGYNSRLDEVQAAILRFKLKNLDKYVSKRRKVAERYYKELKDTALELPFEDTLNKHAYYVFVCRSSKRDQIIEKLRDRGVLLNISYKYPIHIMRGFKFMNYKKGDFPKTEQVMRGIFSLPMYPELSVHDQDRVILELKRVLEAIK